MFAEEGGTVILADVVEDPGREIARQLRKSGAQSLFVRLDTTSQSDWKATVRLIRRKFGSLRVLLNNAGIISRIGIGKINLKEWKRVIDVNLMGPMLGIKAVAPLMRDSGGGAIVNIGSTAGLAGHPGVAYASSKWGLRGMTACAAMEYLDWGIRVNAVHPAQVINARVISRSAVGYRCANERAMPMKRAARPDEVARAVLFLASEEVSYITAADLAVDGGATSIGLARVRALMEQDHNRA